MTQCYWCNIFSTAQWDEMLEKWQQAKINTSEYLYPMPFGSPMDWNAWETLVKKMPEHLYLMNLGDLAAGNASDILNKIKILNPFYFMPFDASRWPGGLKCQRKFSKSQASEYVLWISLMPFGSSCTFFLQSGGFECLTFEYLYLMPSAILAAWNAWQMKLQLVFCVSLYDAFRQPSVLNAKEILARIKHLNIFVCCLSAD